MTLRIDELLHEMVRKNASDLHVKAGSPPGFRIDGQIEPQMQYGVLRPDATADLARQLMGHDRTERFQHDKDLDFSYAVKDLARFRVNALHQRGSVGVVVRQIPDDIPNAQQLGLPPICLQLALKPRGLVLVTGPTGSGKSTTLAAMIDHINQNVKGHILTMEDPLEFVHSDKQCYVTQRQMGQDCESFSQALRRALRQDPNVILIGEMRDLETISLAISAAETGHLVFGTLHTTSAISTVDRIIDVFPTDAQQQVRVQLSTTLQGVISQVLVPKTGSGRVAVHEILIASDGMRSLVREGKTAQMLNLLQTGRGQGMTTLESELVRHALAGTISAEAAISKANRPDEVRNQLAAAARNGVPNPVADARGGPMAGQRGAPVLARPEDNGNGRRSRLGGR